MRFSHVVLVQIYSNINIYWNNNNVKHLDAQLRELSNVGVLRCVVYYWSFSQWAKRTIMQIIERALESSFKLISSSGSAFNKGRQIGGRMPLSALALRSFSQH